MSFHFVASELICDSVSQTESQIFAVCSRIMDKPTPESEAADARMSIKSDLFE